MSEKRTVELIARGVCVSGDRILLCHSKGAENTFLPGGHVEWEESARAALRREIEEELGMEADVGSFLGVVEHKFVQGRQRKPHHEINLVFMMDIAGADPRAVPEACETAIEFLWTRLTKLADSRLEPGPLRELIPEWLAGVAGEPAGWGSTIEA